MSCGAFFNCCCGIERIVLYIRMGLLLYFIINIKTPASEIFFFEKHINEFKKMVKLVLTFSLLIGLFLTSCSNSDNQTNEKDTTIVQNQPQNNDELIGRWVEPNPIKQNEVQGIELLKEGKAKSINMATLLYSKWWTKNNQLFLVEESIGNQTSSIDTISYDIIKIDSDSLILRNLHRTLKYKKQ